MGFAVRYHAWIRDEFAAHVRGDVAEVGGTCDRLFVPMPRALESWVRPPLGKNLLLVARKA